MERNWWAIASIVGIGILVLSASAWVFFVRTPQPFDIDLRSAVPGVSLAWNDEPLMQRILAERFLPDGAYDLSNRQFQPVHRIVITLVPEKQDMLVTYTGDPSEARHVSSGSYLLAKDILFLNIYLRPDQSGLPQAIRAKSRDIQFNEKVVQFLIAVTPRLTTRGPEEPTTTAPTPMQDNKAWISDQELEDISRRYFHATGVNRLNGIYPIHLTGRN